MKFSTYYLLKNFLNLEENTILESVETKFDIRKFVIDNKKKHLFQKHVLNLSKKYPQVRNCDIEDSILESLSSLIKKKPKNKSSANKLFKKIVEENLNEIIKKGKKTKRKLSCLKSIKSFSLKGIDIDEIIGKAKGILTNKEKTTLQLCASGHSVRQISKIINVSFSTAWRILNKGLDKVRISHGMKSRYKDKR